MSSRYDDLNAVTQLEQAVHADLRDALEARDCVVEHRGTPARNAPGGGPDILIRDPANRRLILVEVTKRRSTGADGEFTAIVDHLDQAIAAGGYDDYGLLYVSPGTSARMRSAIADMGNRHREREGRPGRIVALDFGGLETILDRLKGAPPGMYPASRLGQVFGNWEQARDDTRALRLLVSELFGPEDDLLAVLDVEAAERDTAAEQDLRRRMAHLEDQIRGDGITAMGANSTLILLTFMRLYEEKRQRELGLANRMTRTGFIAWRDSPAIGATVRREYGARLVEYLLHEIAEDPILIASGLLRDNRGSKDNLHRRMNDSLLLERVLPVFDEYDFSGSLLDVLGVVFETLARRAQKDTKIGQFFTPASVVDFCAQMVGLRSRDVVLDPAVGTARFLIAAMNLMLAEAPTEGGDQEAIARRIREGQLLGVDLDDWVATIAKMNMFIHGDGKTNIAQGNGLVLADTGTLRAFPAGIRGNIDVVLTNPPLGNVSFLRAGHAWGEQHPAATEADLVRYYESLGVVPLIAGPTSTDERRRARLLERIAAADARLGQLLAQPQTTARDRAIDRVRASNLALTAEVAALGPAVAGTRRPRGENIKGGALFLGAIHQYLKATRDTGVPYEWQGGRALVVVDEAILNTADYARVRSWIRRHFFVKAVVSLGRSAFRYLAHTDAKTSILYLVRKPDPAVEQREPIFFTHAEKCGFSATGRWIGSDLDAVLETFRAHEAAVLGAYRAGVFRPEVYAGTATLTYPLVHVRPDTGGESRLSFWAAHYDNLSEELAASGRPMTTLGQIIEPRVGQPPVADRRGEYPFAAVERLTATVKPKGIAQVGYALRELWTLEEGDIVVSGIDLLNGAVGVAGPDVAGLVMSKEMFAYRVKPGVEALPGYVALMLRTPLARDLVYGLVSGTSNRTRVTGAEQILALPVPALPDIAAQRAIVRDLDAAIISRAEANAGLLAAETVTAAAWPALRTALGEDEIAETDEGAA